MATSTPHRKPTPTPTMAPTRPPTAAPKPTTTKVPSAREQIQDVANTYYRALDSANVDQLNQTLDLSNSYWTNAQRDLLPRWHEESSSSKVTATVVSLEPARYGLYKVTLRLTVNLSYGGTVTEMQDVVVRRVGNGWKLTEPTQAQLGRVLRKRGNGVTVEYYAWDASESRQVLSMAQKDLQHVTKVLKISPRRIVIVRLVPSYSVSPREVSSESVGYYLEMDPNRVYLRSPGSFGFGTYSEHESPYSILSQVTQHELTHLLSDRKVGLSGVADWMAEGLAEWVSNNPREYTVAKALAENQLYNPVTMNDFSSLDNKSLAYGESYELVDYIIKKKGINAYWKMVRVYKKTDLLNEAIRKSVGVDLPTFERNWKQWLRNKYGY